MKLTDLQRQDAYALLEKMISFDTQNPPGRETPLAQWLETYLEKAGCQVELQPVAEGRSNLIVTLAGKDSSKPNLMFNGHLDIVPVGEVDQWNTPPLSATCLGDKIFGRGVSDMKGGLAAMAWALATLAKAEVVPPQDCILIATCDEESGGTGAEAFMTHPLWPKVGAILIGEPTANELSIASKGTLWLTLHIHGKSAHGSQPQEGISAILQGIALTEEIASLLITPPHPVLGVSTCSITQIQGGVKVNMIPEDCTITLDIRTLPQINHKILLEQIQTLVRQRELEHPGLTIQVEVENNRPSVQIEEQHSFVKKISALLEKNTSISPTLTASTFFSDASVFVKTREVPTLLFGPGEPLQAHKTNEYMLLEQYYESAGAYAEFMTNLSLE